MAAMTKRRSSARAWWGVVAGVAICALAAGAAAARAQSAYRIFGHVAVMFDCTGDYAGVLVVLAPLGRVTTTAADGTFAFAGIPDGEYTVVVAPECSPSAYCFDPVSVRVRGADAEVAVCFNPSDCPTDRVRLEPVRVRAGAIVEVSGRCYFVHSGGLAIVYFEDQRVAEVRADTSGGYQAVFAVPPEANPGPHTVRIVSAGGMEIGRASVVVAEALGACTGDCNADGVVSVDELVAGVALALGSSERRACVAAYCNADCGPGPAVRRVGVDCVVRAVRDAVGGCPADQCEDDADCDDGNPCSIDQCTASGCVAGCACVSPSGGRLQPGSQKRSPGGDK